MYHEDGSRNLLHYFTMSTWTGICFWTLLTNQIHKWSHTYKPPALVILAQNCGLILSRKNHGVHHRPPFDKYYCITNGWLNPVLAYIVSTRVTYLLSSFRCTRVNKCQMMMIMADRGYFLIRTFGVVLKPW